jgi:SAM-dependent methyltransferase
MCPSCQSSEYTLIGSPYINPKVTKIIRKDYKVAECNSCGLYYIIPQIDFSAEEWKYLYDENYFFEKSSWYHKNRERDRKERFNNIIKYSSNEIRNFLDVGCGEGYCLLEAESRGWNAFGLDINDNRIDKAKKNNINFINSDLPSSKLREDFFDVVYMDSVLEHVINPLDYLSETKRILKKGGILYIGVPNEDSLFNDFKKLFYKISSQQVAPKIKPFKSPYHIIGFNKNSLENILNRSLFKIEKLRNFACRLEFLKEKPFTKEYFRAMVLLPIYFMAIPIRKEVYFEVYAKKQD